MTILDNGTEERHGRDGVWCDPCLAPLIGALNPDIRTISSCCGHGVAPGSIALADGRWLLICATYEEWENLMPRRGPNEDRPEATCPTDCHCRTVHNN